MKKTIPLLTLASLLLSSYVTPSLAAVNVERHGTENPMVEVSRATLYGALTGLVVGGAIALAVNDSDSSSDIMRWSIVGGTLVGLGVGLWFVSRRPSGEAMLQIQDGQLRVNAVPPVEFQVLPEEGAAARLRLVGVSF